MKYILGLIASATLLFGAVDINTANVNELSTLDGIGESKAKAIIDYRKKNCFKTIDDLAKVKGIGKKTVEKNKKNLKASACKK